jgi:hypothetical protein
MRLDGVPEKVKSRSSRGSKSTSKEAMVVPAEIAEPDLFELEEELPPPHALEEDDPLPIKLDPEPEATVTFELTLRRSAQTRRPTAQYQKYLEQRNMAFVAQLSESEEVDESYYDALHEDDYRIQDDMRNIVAFTSATDEDTMYYDQAMRAPEKHNFVEEIVKEVNDHITSNHWDFIPRYKVPKGIKVLDYDWSLKRKRDIETRKVHKHKARLNVHSGQHDFAVNFFDTFSPGINWFSVRLIFTLSLLSGWSNTQLDFVLAYPQAPIEFDIYMNLPNGIIWPVGTGIIMF